MYTMNTKTWMYKNMDNETFTVYNEPGHTFMKADSCHHLYTIESWHTMHVQKHVYNEVQKHVSMSVIEENVSTMSMHSNEVHWLCIPERVMESIPITHYLMM